MIAVVNGANERTEFTYDLLGRMLTKTTLVGTVDVDVTTFVYDEDDDDGRPGYFNTGALTSTLDAAGYRETDYDELGRPERVERSVDQLGYEFTHAYNVAGLPASTTYPDAQTISWTYDAAGGLQTETGTIASSVYDASGRPTSRSFTNGTITTYDYSVTRGWLDGIETMKGSTTLQDLDYARYADGMVQSATSAKQDESWSYTYDDLNRLTAAANVDNASLSQSFTYNDIGNIISNSAIGTYFYPAAGADRPHAVTAAGGRTYQYDAAGRMTNRNGTIINWNGDGKPSSIGNVGFTYGGTGERLKKVSGGQTTRYIGGDYEIADDGTVTKYLQGGKQVGTSFFVHHRDHLDSIRSVTDNTGVEVRGQAHMPFGDQYSVTGSHLESKGWIGEREEETELVYLNARYYDPEIGRFASPDPLADVTRLNRYTYSKNNPTNLKDPSGLKECVWFFDPFGDCDLDGTHRGAEFPGFFEFFGRIVLPPLISPPRPGPGPPPEETQLPRPDAESFERFGESIEFLGKGVWFSKGTGVSTGHGTEALDRLQGLLGRIDQAWKRGDLSPGQFRLLRHITGFRVSGNPLLLSEIDVGGADGSKLTPGTAVLDFNEFWLRNLTDNEILYWLGHEAGHIRAVEVYGPRVDPESFRVQRFADGFGRRLLRSLGVSSEEIGEIDTGILELRRSSRKEDERAREQ